MPLTTEQGSWIGSVNCLGSFSCYIIYGYLISAVGSKRATLLLTIPSVLGWTLIYFGDNYYYLLLGRFFGGGVSGAGEDMEIKSVSTLFALAFTPKSFQ